VDPDELAVEEQNHRRPRSACGYSSRPGVPEIRSSTRIEPVANTSRKSPVPNAR
jgi:hypothetical protein